MEMFYMEGQVGMWRYNDRKKERLKEVVLEDDPLPWASLYKQMDELLVKLDWDILKELMPEG
jgi:hypothetical protein